MRILSHAAAFVLLYLLFMLATYALPYLGSNWNLGYGMAAAGKTNELAPAFFLHFGALAVLVALTAIRGRAIGQRWLIVLPILAAVFDLVPVLSWIPLVPTILHILTITLGVALAPKAAVQSVTASPSDVSSATPVAKEEQSS